MDTEKDKIDIMSRDLSAIQFYIDSIRDCCDIFQRIITRAQNSFDNGRVDEHRRGEVSFYYLNLDTEKCLEKLEKIRNEIWSTKIDFIKKLSEPPLK